MGVLAFDTFQRANQSGFGTASDGETWNKLTGSSPTLAIASNEGTWTGVTSSATYALGANLATDAEALVRFQMSAAGDSVGLFLRSDANALNLYRTFVQNSLLTLGKIIGGTSTAFSNTAIPFSINTFYWLRFRVDGSNLFAKFWADGSPEPGNWTSTASDTALTAAGRFGMRNSLSTAADTVSVDSYSLSLVHGLIVPTQVTFRDGQAKATFRDGVTNATFRDGLVQVGGR